MLYQKIPQRRQCIRKSYAKFCGVDMSTAVTEVDEKRSPWAPNMIADESGFPCKRPGHEKFLKLDGAINGIYRHNDTMYVHAGVKLYKVTLSGKFGKDFNAATTMVYSALADAKSNAYVSDGKLFILDGNRLIYIENNTVKFADENGYIPTTAISMKPTGGGKDFEGINLLSPYRINSYWIGTDEAAVKAFNLDAENIEAVTKVEKMDANGKFVTISGYTVDTTKGIVTFATAPGATPISGEDNLKITFKKTVAGYADRINKCRIWASYGINNDTRIFVSGNPNFKNYDWYCESGKPLHFRDTGYSVIGGESSAIMGYLRQYDALVIVKEQGDGNDATIFLRTATLDNENKALFPVRQGIAGAGAVSMHAICNFNDDNVFLTDDGVKGLDTQQVSQQRALQERGERVAVPLKKEIKKHKAVFVSGGGLLYLFINGKVYIADGKQKTNNGAGSYGYEWFYWTDVPAISAAYIDGTLYFGDDEGGLYYFKTETDFGMACYSDSDIQSDIIVTLKKPIYAAWTTKMDRLGDSSVFKKITKTGTGVVIKPYAKTDGTICYIVGETETDVKSFDYTTVFDFDDIDFSDFDFGQLPNPYFVPARKKKRKAKMFQMKVENNELDSAFGIYEMRVNYILCNYIK